MTTPTPTPTASGTATAFESYLSYPFQTDQTFQQGIASILSNNLTPEIKSDLLLRARVFYFNRTTGHSITPEQVKEYEQTSTSTTIIPSTTEPTSISTSTSQPTTTNTDANEGSVTTKEVEISKADEQETQVLTFAELKNLIETGQMDKIPNNKQIPSSLNEESPSISNAQTRKKPWELTLDSDSSENQTQQQ